MQILRLPPYPISITYTVPDANTPYVFVIEDVENQEISQEVVTSTNLSKVTLELPTSFSKYDKSYSLAIYEEVDEDVLSDEAVVEDNLEIARPYVNPRTLATTATDIAIYTEYESLARAIIDAVTPGFYFNKTYIEVVGQGTDYVPLWERTHKVLKAYENAELTYDSSLEVPAIGSYNYLITKDKTAITKDPVQATDSLNRAERRYAKIPVAPSDSISMFDTEDSGNTATIVPGVGFPEGADYIFQVETGYKVVPYDIQDATLMLIEDIKCGKLDYYKRYVKIYETDQFKIDFDPKQFNGTGNILVDKILNKYINATPRLRIL
jgi:hypothetical protein